MQQYQYSEYAKKMQNICKIYVKYIQFMQIIPRKMCKYAKYAQGTFADGCEPGNLAGEFKLTRTVACLCQSVARVLATGSRRAVAVTHGRSRPSGRAASAWAA